MLIFNTQFETLVMGEFKVPLEGKVKTLTSLEVEDLSKKDYHNDNPL